MKYKLVCENRELIYDSYEHTLNIDNEIEKADINIEHHCGDGGIKKSPQTKMILAQYSTS